MEAGYDGELLHGQLLGGLLVTMTTTALDLGPAAEVLWSGESRQTASEVCMKVNMLSNTEQIYVPDGRTKI